MVYTLLFISSKCSLSHNSNVFGSRIIIHILYTGCAKIKKKFKRQNVKNMWSCVIITSSRNTNMVVQSHYRRICSVFSDADNGLNLTSKERMKSIQRGPDFKCTGWSKPRSWQLVSEKIRTPNLPPITQSTALLGIGELLNSEIPIYELLKPDGEYRINAWDSGYW